MQERFPPSLHQSISQKLSVSVKNFQPLSGGCINNGGKLLTSKGNFFVKWNDTLQYPNMFDAEAQGLQLLRRARAIRIPEVVLTGEVETFQYIVLEFVEQARPLENYWEMLGAQLSTLHKNTANNFGLDSDNYIGSLPQRNTRNENWISFFVEERLRPQVERAVNSRKLQSDTAKQFEILYNKLLDLLPEEKPSLLHGDLWSGNVIVDENGNPCLIDPAVYFGNREAEIAFTKLFGGFGNEFYDSYHSNFPLPGGFQSRVHLYNLYPILVHVNLFGGSYISQVVSILRNYV
ncbi:MAG TPA: fructosamine kinase family protein [Chryseosolibacter sp.]